MSAITLDSIVSRSSSQVSTKLSTETVILGLASEEYYALREVGARIWDIIEDSQPARQILATLLREYDVASERCERDLLAILHDLADAGLVEVTCSV